MIFEALDEASCLDRLAPGTVLVCNQFLGSTWENEPCLILSGGSQLWLFSGSITRYGKISTGGWRALGDKLE